VLGIIVQILEAQPTFLHRNGASMDMILFVINLKISIGF
jgi:hypothetical protein